MRKTVWKFPLPITDHVSIPMPRGAKILHVEAQDDQPHIWALVDSLAELVPRHFKVFGTGHPIDDEIHVGQHVGTLQLRNGLVWHVFETTE